uniref:Uncharacterized protein n=1 Tax=Rhizophora mucronata TaxID=61149 RepID=A0A2P2KUR6_RHIMU
MRWYGVAAFLTILTSSQVSHSFLFPFYTLTFLSITKR